MSLFEIYQLNQLIEEPTRVTKTTATLIDHFITNSSDKISKNGVIHTGLSDHSLIYGIRKINIFPKDKKNIAEIRNLKKFVPQNFIKDLLEQCRNDIYFYGENPHMWEMWSHM